MFSRASCRTAARTTTSLNFIACSATRTSRRAIFNSPPTIPFRKGRRFQLGTLALTGALSGSAYAYLQRPPVEDTLDAEVTNAQLHISDGQQAPLSALIRTYIVYSMCSIPFIVDYSPSILSALSSVPGIKQITELLVRATFFNQFVGGDTALETKPVLAQLRTENKGAVLNYSAEVDEHDALGENNSTSTKTFAHKSVVEELLRCIDVAGDFEDERQAMTGLKAERKTWVAVKLTALLPDAKTLINFSKYLVASRPSLDLPVPFPGAPRPSDLDILNSDPKELPSTCPMSHDDLIALKDLKIDLFRVCQRAKDRGVTIMIDAEYSWYQPAVDAFQFALMHKFNRLPPNDLVQVENNVQPLIYGTFQTYLRRAPEQLAQALLDAKKYNFALGVKLVRGAYHQFETTSHNQLRTNDRSSNVNSSLSISPEELPPVWQTKAETDACFDGCARMLVKCIAEEVADERQRADAAPSLGLLFGTHNAASCDLVLDSLVTEGLADRTHDGHAEGEIICIRDPAARRVTIGQLYGMCDALSNSLVDRTRSSEIFVVKYLPYGALSEVMPYLGRRAVENKSVLGDGAARAERERAGKEIRKRLREYFFG